MPYSGANNDHMRLKMKRQTSIRIPDHIYERARQVAEDEDRSLANLIVRAVREYLDRSPANVASDY